MLLLRLRLAQVELLIYARLSTNIWGFTVQEVEY